MELTALSISELRLRLRIVEQVIADAQRDGDERWRILNDEQAEPLRQALKEVMTRAGMYPAPVVIEAKVGVTKGKGNGSG